MFNAHSQTNKKQKQFFAEPREHFVLSLQTGKRGNF